jgi:zinc protease
MKKLSREDAMRFYKHYYAPNNSILVVAGDVTTEEVKKLAEETYGKIPANPDVNHRERPTEPPYIAARRLEYKDPRAGNASFHRYYVLPSYVTAEPGEAEALDLLFKIVAGGATSRLYKKLVVDEKIAATSGGDYAGWGLDSGAVSIYAVAADGVGLDDIEAKVDEVLDDVRANGVTAAELERAKKTFLANFIYDSDNQARLARRYGWALTVGRSVNDIESWPDAISKVTLEDVQKVAAKYLDIRRSVTGWLLPEAAQGQGDGGKKVKQPAVHTRS